MLMSGKHKTQEEMMRVFMQVGEVLQIERQRDESVYNDIKYLELEFQTIIEGIKLNSKSNNNTFNFELAYRIMKIKELSQELSSVLKCDSIHSTPSGLQIKRNKTSSLSCILSPWKHYKSKMSKIQEQIQCHYDTLQVMEQQYSDINIMQQSEVVFELERLDTSRLLQIYHNEQNYIKEQLRMSQNEVIHYSISVRLDKLINDATIKWIQEYLLEQYTLISAMEEYIGCMHDLLTHVNPKTDSTYFENSRNSFIMEAKHYSLRSNSNMFEISDKQHMVLKEISNEVKQETKQGCVQCLIF